MTVLMRLSVGPFLAGRLRGRAQLDPTGHIDIGDSALVRLSVEEVLDPLTGAVIQAAIPSGVQPFYMRYEVPSEKLNNFKLRRRWKCSLSFVEVVFQSLSGVCSGSSTWKRL